MMDKSFENLIKINIQGRVFVSCRSRGMRDLATIGYYVEILEQSILSMLSEASTPEDFNQVLNDQMAWLEDELDQILGQPGQPAVEEEAAGPGDSAGGKKQATRQVLEAKTMIERLKDARADMEHLLDNECVALMLVTPGQARQYKLGLLGKEVEAAEEELVANLRTVLHEQVRSFIRNNDGGPWATATQQHELRLDIGRVRTLRSLVKLAGELSNETEAWLLKTKNTLAGRLFGKQIKVNK